MYIHAIIYFSINFHTPIFQRIITSVSMHSDKQTYKQVTIQHIYININSIDFQKGENKTRRPEDSIQDIPMGSLPSELTCWSEVPRSSNERL